VVLVTTEHEGTFGKVQRGLTVSSFTTICLTPSPFICFSTRQNSRAADLIALREYFVVTLLPCTPESAHLAEAFSKSDLASHPDAQLRNPFELGRWRREERWELPILDDGLGTLLCRVDKAYNVGDHKLWIAEVRDAITQDISEATALGYCKREYRKEGDPIRPSSISRE
jgi:flavin reductase (DIM6/NTAB) family NADH-FMN oxidoreductase RutF